MDMNINVILNKIYKEINDINHDYISSCKEYIDNKMLEKNTDLDTFIEEEINQCEVYLMVHNWVYNTMSRNQIDKFVTKYGIRNILRHHLKIKEEMIHHYDDSVPESLEYYANIMLCKELDIMIKNNPSLEVIPQTMVISLIYDNIKNNIISEYDNDIYMDKNSMKSSQSQSFIDMVSFNDLGADNISIIYDELRGKNKDYIKQFNTYFCKTFKTYKCSDKPLDYIHTDKCHDKVANITFEYIIKLDYDDINQIIINYGIGDAIGLLYTFYTNQSNDCHQMFGKRIKSNIEWNGVSWDIETEMVFHIFMQEVYKFHTFE